MVTCETRKPIQRLRSEQFFCYRVDFTLSDPIIFKTVWQSDNIFFRLLDNNAVEHIFEGDFQ